jgi:CYTH domain-containing protein
MAQEIERKFLVIGEFKSSAFAQSHIVQGYISSARGRTVRVRIRENDRKVTFILQRTQMHYKTKSSPQITQINTDRI